MPTDKYWKISPASEPHYLKLEDAEFLESEAWPRLDASVKWDGCIHLSQTDDPASEDGLYWHLCGDLDQFIERLQELRDKAKAYFGEGSEYAKTQA